MSAVISAGLRAAILAEARAWIGTPYMHRASVRGVGADCLGLVRGVWRAVIGPEPEAMPPYAPDWAEAGRVETLAEVALRHLQPVPLEAVAPGDVLLFRFRPHLPAKHAAILSGEGRMIHAYDGACVCESALVPWWRRRLAMAFAFPEVVALSWPSDGAAGAQSRDPAQEVGEAGNQRPA